MMVTANRLHVLLKSFASKDMLVGWLTVIQSWGKIFVQVFFSIVIWAFTKDYFFEAGLRCPANTAGPLAFNMRAPFEGPDFPAALWQLTYTWLDKICLKNFSFLFWSKDPLTRHTSKNHAPFHQNQVCLDILRCQEKYFAFLLKFWSVLSQEAGYLK